MQEFTQGRIETVRAKQGLQGPTNLGPHILKSNFSASELLQKQKKIEHSPVKVK